MSNGSDRRRTAALAVAAGCLLVAGCGGGNSKPGEAGLARPVYPRCVPGKFAKPRSMPVKGPNGGRAWQVAYLYPPPPAAPPLRGQTTNVLIAEQSPELSRGRIRQGTEMVIAGRHVSFHRPDSRGPVFAAQWKTSRARYVVLANGSRDATLRGFIRCLP